MARLADNVTQGFPQEALPPEPDPLPEDLPESFRLWLNAYAHQQRVFQQQLVALYNTNLRSVDSALRGGQIDSTNLAEEYRELTVNHGVAATVRLAKLNTARTITKRSAAGQAILDAKVTPTGNAREVSITFWFADPTATNVKVSCTLVEDGVSTVGNPTWSDPILKSILTATGDVIYATAASTPSRLGIGSSGQVLSVSGGVPTWATGPTGAMPSGGVLEQSIVNTASGTGAWGFPVPHHSGFARRSDQWAVVLNSDTTFTSVLLGNALSHFGAAAATHVSVTHNAGGERPALQAATITGAGTASVWGSANYFIPRNRPRMRALVQSPSALANLRFGIAFESAGTNATAPANAASVLTFVRIVYDAGVSANWLLNSGDGANQSYTDTGLAVATSTDYYIDLDWSVGTSLTSRIYVGAITNAPTVTTKSTNLSTGTTNLGFELFDTNLAAGTIAGFATSGFTWDAY